MVYHTEHTRLVRGYNRAEAVPISQRKRSVVASLVLVLLFAAMTAAAWHHHDKANLETCQACYLSKHTLAPPSADPIGDVLTVVSPHRGSYAAPPRQLVAFRRADFRAPPAESPSQLGQ